LAGKKKVGRGPLKSLFSEEKCYGSDKCSDVVEERNLKGTASQRRWTPDQNNPRVETNFVGF